VSRATSPVRSRCVSVLVEDPVWRRTMPKLVSTVRKAGSLTLQKGSNARVGNLTILLTNDERVRALNTQFRGKDKPTDVLSFPSGAGDYLGDVAIAYGVASREAESDGKTLAEHVAHLAVHGVLHLLGYDHERASEAEIMESIETQILAELGIPNPYDRRKRAA